MGLTRKAQSRTQNNIRALLRDWDVVTGGRGVRGEFGGLPSSRLT